MRVLCIGAHPDDVEFGCGATLHKHLQRLKNWEVRCITLSRSLDAQIEAANVQALTELGVPREHIALFNFPTSDLHSHRQAVWRELDLTWRQFRPQLVFTHEHDYHQDHETVFKESMRTFYDASVLSYGIERSKAAAFEGSFYSVVNHRDVSAKLAALQHYSALQISDGVERTTYAQKAYFQEEAIIGKMAADGVGALARYAEVFRVVRWIARDQ